MELLVSDVRLQPVRRLARLQAGNLQGQAPIRAVAPYDPGVKLQPILRRERLPFVPIRWVQFSDCGHDHVLFAGNPVSQPTFYA